MGVKKAMEKMKIIKITEGKLHNSKILRRKAWILTDKNTNVANYINLIDASFNRRRNYEEIIIEYPDYVAGTRLGEARYVHLPSYPARILWRLHRAINQ